MQYRMTVSFRATESYGYMCGGILEEERRAFVATLQKMLANVRRHDL